MLVNLGSEGIRRPYSVVTMDTLWFECAAELGRPRYFFRTKLPLMQFCLGHELVALIAKDKQPETWSMGASLAAMDAVELAVACDEEVL